MNEFKMCHVILNIPNNVREENQQRESTSDVWPWRGECFDTGR